MSQTPRRSWFGALLGGSLAIAAFAAATASPSEDRRADDTDREEDDESEEEDDDRGPERVKQRFDEKREPEIDVDRRRVLVDLSRGENLTREHLQLGFEFETAALELRFTDHEIDERVEETLEARLLGLVEFQDLNGNGGYDLSDVVVSGFDLSWARDNDDNRPAFPRAEWRAEGPHDVRIGDQKGQRLLLAAPLSHNGTFLVSFLIFGDFVRVATTDLRPTSVKMDFEVHAYPYRAPDTDLALLLLTRASSERVETMAADPDGGVQSSQSVLGGELKLSFTWVRTATVDGVDRAVEATRFRHVERLVEEEDHELSRAKDFFALSYPRGTHVVHDPEFSATFVLPEPPVSVWTGALVAVTLVLVAAILINYQNLRRQP